MFSREVDIRCKQIISTFCSKKYCKVIIASVLLVVVVIIGIKCTMPVKDGGNKYKNSVQVDYDRYTDVVCAIADASIGIPISEERVQSIQNSVLPETYESIKDKINNLHVGEVQETERSVEEKMDAIFGGSNDIDYTKYYTRVVESNFYCPDIYVFKLVNDSGNTVIITVTIQENGGIKNVQTSV